MQERLIKIFRISTPYFIRFRYAIIGALIVGVFAFAVFRIDSVLQTERDEDAYNAQLLEVKQVKFDQAAAEQIRGLEKSEAEINAEIEADRENPFQ